MADLISFLSQIQQIDMSYIYTKYEYLYVSYR